VTDRVNLSVIFIKVINVKRVKKEDIVVYIISVLLIVITVLSMIALRSDKGIFGYTVRIVISGSMEPTIHKNTFNIIKVCNLEDISIGDIICYRYDRDIIHRVVDLKYDDNHTLISVVTKGDANKTNDDIVITDEMIIGRVIKTFNDSYIIIDKVRGS